MSFIKKIKGVDLTKYDHGLKEYADTYLAADQYAYNVLTEHQDYITGQHAKNTCARYIYDREFRDGIDIELRPQEADDVLKFSLMLKHVKGKMAGRPMQLMLWMSFVLVNIFGWYYVGTETRRFTKAFTLIGRGNAKSTLCSIIALYTILLSPNGSPAAYSVARTAKQAGIVFNDAKKMIGKASQQLRGELTVMARQILSNERQGIFEPLASDSQSLDGLRVSLGICDELHAHHNADLMNALVSGVSATENPLIFAISTAGIQLDGICIDERNLVRLINEDMEQLDTYFGIEYSIDDKDDWKDERCWPKANPSLHHAVKLSALKAELARAMQSATNRKNFLTKFCNVFVNTNDSPFLDVLDLQQKCAREDLTQSAYKGRECYAGLDLAQKIDLAALSILFPEDDGTVTAFQRHYIPEGAVNKSTMSRQEMYEQWEEDGHLIITPGNSTDYEYIKEDIRWAAKHHDLKMVGYDPYSATQLALSLEDENIDMVEVKQGISHLSEPAKLLQSIIVDGKLNYQASDKCFEWCAANAACYSDQNENLKVIKSKDKPHDKIDSVIAMIIGLALAELKEPKKQTPYRKRGMVVL